MGSFELHQRKGGGGARTYSTGAASQLDAEKGSDWIFSGPSVKSSLRRRQLFGHSQHAPPSTCSFFFFLSCL